MDYSKKFDEIVGKNVYQEILENIKNGKNFSFVRYGDGEWGMILKKPQDWYIRMGKNWGPEIYAAADEMRQIILSHPKYIIGMQPSGLSRMKEDVLDLVGNYDNLVNANIFHIKSEQGDIQDFFDLLKQRNVILVGTRFLGKLKEFPFQHVVTAEESVWKHNDDLKKQIEEAIQKTKDPVILYSASFSSKILIDYFYNQYQDNITQIDTGSLFDPYVGLLSRSYHTGVIKRLNIPEDKIIISNEKKKNR